MWPAYVLLLWLLQSRSGVTAMLKVMINSQEMEVIEATNDNELVLKAKYNFVPEERVRFTCLKEMIDNSDALSVVCPQYNYSSVPEKVKYIKFKMILEAHHHNTHVDCILHVPKFKSVLRVHMYLKKQYDEEKILRVNGLAVRQLGDIVEYTYFGPKLQVACGMNDATGCKKKYIAVVSDIPQNGICIGGMQDDKVLFEMYTNAQNERIIVYGYNDNDILYTWFNNKSNSSKNLSEKLFNYFSICVKKGWPAMKVYSKDGNKGNDVIIANDNEFKNITNMSFIYIERYSFNGNNSHEDNENRNTEQSDLKHCRVTPAEMNTISAICVGVVVGVLITASVFIIRSRCKKTPPRPPLALPIQTEPEQQNEYDYVYSHMPNRQLKKTAAERTVRTQRGGHRIVSTHIQRK